MAIRQKTDTTTKETEPLDVKLALILTSPARAFSALKITNWDFLVLNQKADGINVIDKRANQLALPRIGEPVEGSNT